MLLIAAAVLATHTYSTPPKLIAYWSGNGNASDSAGGVSAKPMGAVTYEPGIIGKAFDFDGYSSVVFIPDSPKFKLRTGLTLSCWVAARAYAKHGSSPQAPIIFRGDDRNGLDPFQLVLTSDGEWRFGMDDAQNQRVSIGTRAGLNQWTHLCATWDGATGKMVLYVNGQVAATTVTQMKPLVDLDVNFHPGVSIGNVQNPFGDNHYQPFNGLIEQVKIYDGALAKSDFVRPVGY